MPGKDQGRDKERTAAGHTSHKESRHHHHHHHHEETRHHKSSHHHHHHGGKHTSDRNKSKTTTTHHGGKKGGGDGRAHRHDAESGRHPSSSIGPGVVEPVLLLMIVIIGISALTLLSIGIWLLAVRNGWPAGLNNTGSIFWTRFISYATACIVLALLFVPIVIIAMCAAIATHGSRARKLRLALIFLLSLASLVLLLMTVTAGLFATNGPTFINQVLAQSWKNTVKDDDNFLVTCDIQKRFECQGWEDNSCRNCAPSINGDYSTPNGTCSIEQREICPRCWSYGSSRDLKVERTSNDVDGSEFGLPVSVNSVMMMKARHRGRQVQQPQQPSQQSPQQVNQVLLGCRRFIQWRNREFFIPMVVYTIFLLLVMILMSWKTCIDSSGRR